LPVLAEVLRAVQIGTGKEVGYIYKTRFIYVPNAQYLMLSMKLQKQKRIASETFADKSALFRYNILPLYPGSTKQPIMLLPEVCHIFSY
jgi:hypothetical protein